MEKIDDLTRGKVREWQMRRLLIKDQMQSQPERTLELAAVLDLMDEEHAAILAQATRSPVDETPPTEVAEQPASPAQPHAALGLQLTISADSIAALRRLLDMAVHELQQEIDAGDQRRHTGGMSGSLGDYRFELTRPSESSGDQRPGSDDSPAQA